MKSFLSLGFFLAALLFQWYDASCQITGSEQKEQLQKGDKLFERGDYAEAEMIYESLYRFDEENREIKKRLGVSKALNFKYEQAIKILQPIVDETDSMDSYVVFQLAEAYRHEMKFDEAIDLYRSVSNDSSLMEKSSLALMQSEFAKEMYKNANVDVYRIGSGINSARHELAPQIILDSVLLFRSQENGSRIPFLEFENHLDNMRYARMSADAFSEAKPFQKIGRNDILDKKQWTFTGVQLGDHNYIYKSNLGDHLSIADYCASDTLVTNIVRFNLIDPSSASVAILPGSKKAYFVRKDSENEVPNNDIYVALKDEKNQWSEVMKLDYPVNTVYNEDFLFWSEEENALYFSSDRGKESIGGYDIFKANAGPNEELEDPVNIGFPVNTPGDDIFFYKKDSVIYYSSEFKQNHFDIFKAITMPTPGKPLPGYVKYHTDPFVKKINEVVICNHFYFDTYSKEVDTLSYAYRKLLRILKGENELRVKITGYADWTGASESNMKLSFERASNLFYSLCMDGVSSDQLSLDFKGSSSLRTAKDFEDKETKENAKAANRCVTVELISFNGRYLYVKDSVDFEKIVIQNDNNRFSVMLLVSDQLLNPVDIGFPEDSDVTKSNGIFYYHTPYTLDIEEAQRRKSELEKEMDGIYLFCKIQ